MNSLQFGKWLALEVLGKILRKSPAKERRGPVRDAAYLTGSGRYPARPAASRAGARRLTRDATAACRGRPAI